MQTRKTLPQKEKLECDRHSRISRFVSWWAGSMQLNMREYEREGKQENQTMGGVALNVPRDS